jgi:hypothetical protein
LKSKGKPNQGDATLTQKVQKPKANRVTLFDKKLKGQKKG